MWRSGVTKRGADAQEALQRPGHWRFALTLLEDLADHFDSRDDLLIEHIYNQTVVGGYVYKTTRRNRFKDVDKSLVPQLQKTFGTSQPIAIHDVGASSGITSLDLLGSCEQAGLDVSMHATDLYDHLLAVPVRGGWTVIFDSDGQPLQYIAKSWVLSARNGESRKLPITVG